MIKKIYRWIGIFLVMLFIPQTLAVSLLTEKMQGFYKIRYLIKNIKKIDDNYVDKLANWILMYADMYLSSSKRYEYAVCLFSEESKFDSVYGDNGRAFGLGQVHLDTAEKMCRYLGIKCSRLSDRLIKDGKFNIQISLAYLGFLETYYDNDIDKAIIAYNTGEGFLDNFLRQYHRLPQTLYYVKIKNCFQSNFSF